MGNKQSEGASLSGNNGQRQEFGQSGSNSQSQNTNHSDNNERFQGGRHSASNNQSQGADHSDNNERFQGGRQSAGNSHQGADHSGNNKRFQGAGQPGNNERSPQVGRPAGDGHIQGFWPSDNNRTEETRGLHNRFNFHTGVPFNGIQHHSENVTEEPGFFGHHIFGNANQQSMY
jgi:hypothetical protein